MSNGTQHLRSIVIHRALLDQEEAVMFERLLEEGVLTPDNIDHFLRDPRPYYRSEGFLVKVDFGVPFGLQVRSGNYGHVDQRFNLTNFPILGKGVVNYKLRLVKPHFTATTPEVRAEIESRGYVPARHEHLLAFGARFGEIQRQFSIAALGYGWSGNVPILSMSGHPEVRSLTLLPESSVWDPDCRFLAIELQKFCGT